MGGCASSRFILITPLPTRICFGCAVAAALLNALVIRAPFQWLLAFALPFALLFPAWFSRHARAVWLAFDLSWHPPEETDFVRREE